MDLGVMVFQTDRGMPPDDLAFEVEKRGFWSLFFPEHTHMPIDHSPYPRGGDLPDTYRRTLDPFVASSAAATATTDLMVGTGVCLVAQHDPIDVAKQVASVDYLSGGRFVFGIGYGWNVPETENHGVRFVDRRVFVQEALLSMKTLWTEEVAEFSGDYVRLSPSHAWPKPVQKPHPPIWLGAGYGPKTERALVEFCDGWMPNRDTGLESYLPRLRQALADAGRDPADFQVFVAAARPDVDQLRYLAGLGIDRAGFWLPSEGRDRVIPVLDEFARVLEEVG